MVKITTVGEPINISIYECSEGYDMKGYFLTEIRFDDRTRESTYIKFRYRIIDGKGEIETLEPLISKHNNNIETKADFHASYRDGRLEVSPELNDEGRQSLQKSIDDLMDHCYQVLTGGDGVFNLCKFDSGKRRITNGMVSYYK